MRKVLLASTALVALGSVSAMAADVTISGTSENFYKSYDKNGGFTADGANGTSFSVNNDVDFNFTQTTDSGLTMTLAVGLDQGGNMDDEKLSIAGDFGTIRISQDQEGVGDSGIDGGAQVNDESSSLSPGLGKKGTSMSTGSQISYYTPSMNGLSAAVSFEDSGVGDKADITEMRIAYSADMSGTAVSVDYVSSSTDDNGTSTTGVDATSMGISIAQGAFAFSGNVATKSDNNATYDYSSTSIGASYTMANGVKIGVYQNNGDDDKNSSYEWEQTAASIDYTIAPGLSTGITLTDSELTNSSGTKTYDDYTVIHLTAKF